MRWLGLAVVVIGLAGCGGGGGDGIDAMRAVDAMVDATEASTVMVSGTVYSIDIGATTFPPLAGATVCVDGMPAIQCATSAAAGEYSLRLPADAALLLDVEAADHQSYLLGRRTGAAGAEIQDLYLATLALTAQGYQTCGGTYPEAMAGVELEAGKKVGASRMPVAGVHVAIADAGATGPCYWGGIAEPDDALTATTVAGIGVTQFQNVSGTSVDLTVTGGGGCTTDPAWTGGAPNVVKAPLRAGAITYLQVDCP
jgi:hypothetical protein